PPADIRSRLRADTDALVGPDERGQSYHYARVVSGGRIGRPHAGVADALVGHVQSRSRADPVGVGVWRPFPMSEELPEDLLARARDDAHFRLPCPGRSVPSRPTVRRR